MVNLRLTATTTPDGAVHLKTDLARLPESLRPAVVVSLSRHLGVDLAALQKATPPKRGGKPSDPRFPELKALIDAARDDWARWSDTLVDEVVAFMADGRRRLDSGTEGKLASLLARHGLRHVLKVAGRLSAPDDQRLAKKYGLSGEGSHVGLGFRLGRALNFRKVHQLPRPTDRPPTRRELARRARLVELTPQDVKALNHVQRKAAIHVRRPVSAALGAVERHLSDAERDLFMQSVSSAVRENKGARDLARDLSEAVSGRASLTNDMDRVARTELHDAHAMGAYLALKEQSKRAGLADPEVYKLTSPRSCRHCRRIWGRPGAPRRYRLSFVEGRVAAGGNYGVSAADWGPVPGPTHPNCTEGPLQLYLPALKNAIDEAAAAMAAFYG